MYTCDHSHLTALNDVEVCLFSAEGKKSLCDKVVYRYIYLSKQISHCWTIPTHLPIYKKQTLTYKYLLQYV